MDIYIYMEQIDADEQIQRSLILSELPFGLLTSFWVVDLNFYMYLFWDFERNSGVHNIASCINPYIVFLQHPDKTSRNGGTDKPDVM